MGATPGQVAWGYGSGVDTVSQSDPTFEAVSDVVINSRINPTLVACPMAAGSDNNGGGGIRVLNTANGSVVSVTNGDSIQTLTNLDWGQAYTCAAWDNVGNLYGASPSLDLWRVWSPPGANQATTYALETVQVIQLPVITGITLGGGNVTIDFTAAANLPASVFALQSAGSLREGSFVTVTGAVASGNAGVFSVSAPTNGATTQFYRISQ
jgi:hypothetical protein